MLKKWQLFKARQMAGAIRNGYDGPALALMSMIRDGKVTFGEVGIDRQTVEAACRSFSRNHFRH